MVRSSAQSESNTPTVVVERIHERLSNGEGPSSEVIRQEATRARLPVSALETLLRLDKRFAKTPAGWEIQSLVDPWPELARALPQSMVERSEIDGLLRQVVIEMSAATRSHFAQHYPRDFTLSQAIQKRIADLVESCPTDSISQLRGPIFDLTMSELFDNADKNRFFTPRAITAFAAGWAQPQPGERILDPCYGSGGFLLAMAQAGERSLAESGMVVEDESTLFETSLRFTMSLRDESGRKDPSWWDRMLFGLDKDASAAWSGKTNLALHGFGGSHLCERDALDLGQLPWELESFDIVVGNPPFGDTIDDPAMLEQFELGRDNEGHPLKRQSSEVLFVEAFLRLAVPGGRVVILLPDGLLANQGEQRLRDFMTSNAIVESVIGLPRRVFRNDAKSNILLLRKKTAIGELQDRLVFVATVEDIWSELWEMHDLYRSGPKSG
jgi:type I restriction enzyme M protein